MVAFIDDHLAVLGDAIVHDIFPDEALNNRHIEEPRRLLRPPPMRPIDLVGRSRNVARRSIHWSKSWRRCTSTNVLTPHWAISQAATTVLPNAVVAAKT